MESNDHPISVAATKLLVVWAGFWASITLHDIYQILSILVQGAVFVFTALQIWILVRDKLSKNKKRLEPSQPGKL